MINFKEILGFAPLLILDDGHGEETAGKRTPAFPDGTVIRENHFNKPVVNLIEQEAKRLGFNTLQVAPEDKDIPLATRSSRANEAYNKLKAELKAKGINIDNKVIAVFVSIHFNAHLGTWESKAEGVETHHYPNSSSGKKLAENIQKYLKKGTPQIDRGVRASNFHVLRETLMPAALVEGGFMDNKREASLMLNKDFQNEVATEVLMGVCDFYGVKYTEGKPNTTTEGLYRVRKTWSDAKSQVGAYKVLENAIAECKKHSGYKVYDETGKEVYPLSPPAEKPKEEAGTLIMGKTEATAAQMVSYALRGNSKPLLPNCSIEELAKIFIEEGQAEGVRADIAWAQSLKETGYFKYGGIVLPEQNNYSGIGALNNNSKGDAAIFDSPRIGARAQIQHLKAYASTAALKNECVDPRFSLVKRGSAKYVEWLGYEDNPNGAGWAYPGKGYGKDIIKILDNLLQEPKESKKDDGVPEWQKEAFRKLVEKKVINTPEAWENKLSETITVGEVIGMLANML